MKVRIDAGMLARRAVTPSEAAALVEDLDVAAPWLLDDATIERALPLLGGAHRRLALSHRDSAPVLPVGGCLPWFLWQDPPPGFAQAWALPVHWRLGPPDPLVPPALHTVAVAMRTALAADAGWHLAGSLADCDFSRLPVAAASAAAALAAGLVLAAAGLRPTAALALSAAWDGAWQPVAGLPAKQLAARRVGAHRLLVAPSQDLTGLGAGAARLPPGALRDSLAPILADLAIPPRHCDGTDRTLRLAYHRLLTDRDRRDSFEMTDLLPDHPPMPGATFLRPVRHLVLIPSSAPRDVQLIRSLAPRQITALITATMAPMWQAALAHLPAGTVTTSITIDEADPVVSVRQALAAWSEVDGDTVVDVSGGTKAMAVAVALHFHGTTRLIAIDSPKHGYLPDSSACRILCL